MKVLFLDVDGVTCTRRAHLAYGRKDGIWNKWDPLATQVLRTICEHGVRIVMSSTWRHDMHKEQLDERMKEHQLSQYLLEDWRTKHLRFNSQENLCRGDEIQEYLDRHPEIDSYRILDDDMDMLQPQMKKLIQTDGEEGMTSENIRALYYWSGVTK